LWFSFFENPAKPAGVKSALHLVARRIRHEAGLDCEARARCARRIGTPVGRRDAVVGFCCLALFLAWLPSARCAAPWDTFSDTWVATDGLGRSLPTAEITGPPRGNRFVGIFYFLWLEGQNPVYDLSKLLAANPANPAYGPKHAFHFWSEPLFGYYRSDDPWVIRKHAQMLADAGVDVVVFDVTNALTYDRNVLAVCAVYSDMRRQGLRTPQIAFLAHSSHDRVVAHLSRDFYAKNLHPDLWFRWQGKPLMMAASEGLSASVTNFFTLRESWAWTDPKGWFGDGRDKWPWLDHSPQNFGWHEDRRKPEQVAVAVAQHPTSNIGRSHRQKTQPPPDKATPEQGIYFSEQWSRALELQPEFTFVTGWNEWIAQRFLNEGGTHMMGRKLAVGETFFVDQYSQEFSRDIEPMKGGHGDVYFYQLAGYIRRLKGTRSAPAVVSRPIAVDGRFEDWREVAPEFRDTIGDVVHRDHAGWQGEPPFKDTTGRNDLVVAKTSLDAANVCFYVRTRDALTPSTDPGWMLLFIDADRDPKTGWLGYDYVLNRSRPGDSGVAILERHTGAGYQWGSPSKAGLRFAVNEIEVAIPRGALQNFEPGRGLNFKWSDNIQHTGEASDFSLHGDSAPNDRFNYPARYAPSSQPR
jgi:hypothetical protein